jgi:hypothetical protein
MFQVIYENKNEKVLKSEKPTYSEAKEDRKNLKTELYIDLLGIDYLNEIRRKRIDKEHFFNIKLKRKENLNGRPCKHFYI